ncbi:hypothetical protein GYN67_01830 [Lactococcus piscium]|uniref:Uncharacterized protein n=1 Tax=Pseudolactococcus carnosus TaxID=2749961 RepID=A0ABT0AR63_9LACT|nr:hypothetical protein [Lactococcus carnosus]MCJ1989141.1 hypothetical protein [Lactococcus carnosus]MCJ1995432.1 hypothetical protein [Lactococcus carnosus]
MEKNSRIFTIATVSFLFILVFETLFELFQVKGTQIRETILGVKISNVDTATEMTTTFSLTFKVFISYLTIIGIFFVVKKIFDWKMTSK